MIYVLDNYEFLEPLVKDGQIDPNDPFVKDGICYANKLVNPDFVYVFKVHETFIDGIYAYARAYNKAFLKFHNEVFKVLFSYNVPVYRIGKNKDFKNHTKLFKTIDNIEIYEFIRK